MKLRLILLLTMAAQQVFAATYQCVNSEKGTSANLIMEGADFIWSEDFHSASSTAIALGSEDAPFSKLKGYQLFKLVDFYMTEDSAHMLALSPSLLSTQGTGQAVTYFDNDDLEEEMTQYRCELLNP